VNCTLDNWHITHLDSELVELRPLHQIWSVRYRGSYGVIYPSYPSLTCSPLAFTDFSVFIYCRWSFSDASQVGTNPNNNPYCYRQIRATRHREGYTNNVTVDVTVVDRCVGCKTYDLDFSPTAFDEMADEALGRVDVTWTFLNWPMANLYSYILYILPWWVYY
jgi:Lytic transglycolase